MLRACLAALLCVSTAATTPSDVSVPCDTQHNLTGNGHVKYDSTAIDHTECWDIACDTDAVLTFSVIDPYHGMYVYVYSSGNDTNFNLEHYWTRSTDTAPFIGVDMVMNGSAFVQFRSVYSSGGWGTIVFDYVCGNATTQAPPTAAPNTRAPGVNYVCEEHTDLGDNVTGNVSFQNYDSYHTECWHIECDKDVVISFSHLQLYTYSYLDLYTSGNDSGNGTNFTLEKRFNNYDSPMDVVLNGSAFVQFRSLYYYGWSRLEFDYVCVDATTQAPPTDVPDTRAPGVNYVCEEHTDLNNATGNTSFQISLRPGGYYTRTRCWHIECDKDVVISFSTMNLYSSSYVDVYTGNDSGNGTDFTLQKRFNYYDSPMDVVLNGSAFVQVRSNYYYAQLRVEFDYVCVDATTQSPPTDVPDTRAPGVSYICEEHNDLGDNATGNVSFHNYDTYHTECWHIECDKDVVISFSTMQLYYNSYLDLYTSGNDSGNGTDFTLEKRFNYYDSPMDVVLNGSAFVQFRSTYYYGWSRLEFDYVCVDVVPTQSPPTAAPDTRAPGVNYVCEEHNDLGDNVTGNVSFQNYDTYHTECWHIECDKDVVISFSHLQLYTYSYLDLYTSGNDSGNGTNFTLEKRFSNYDSPMDVVLNGSAFVQFRSTYYYGWSRLEFDYVCVDATTQAPPTDVPNTRAPGVSYVCEEHNDLGDNVTGNVSFQNYDSYHTECWHIECDKDVVISFSHLQLYTYSYLDLYTSGNDSGNGTNFTLEKRFNHYDSPMDVVLNGSAFVQFRSTYYYGRSRLEFDYVCVDATTQSPPTDVPDTRAPGVNYICEEHNDLGDNVTGNVSFQNYDSYHTECWHIECDKDVVISFSHLQLYTYSYLDLDRILVENLT